MPLYDYLCKSCKHTSEEFYRMHQAPDACTCPACKAEFAYHKQVSRVHTDLREFSTPIEMYSIALDHDEEIEEFKRKCPDVDISMDQNDPNYGIPIARSRKQKLSALKAAGYQEAK
jgi:putative FmdB family regulatory protein